MYSQIDLPLVDVCRIQVLSLFLSRLPSHGVGSIRVYLEYQFYPLHITPEPIAYFHNAFFI